MTVPIRPDCPEDSVERLRTQVARAETAAREAYRDTTRVIRVLTVLGQPGVPDELVEATLGVLSEVFSADVACVAQAVGARLAVTAACGLPEDDPAFEAGWELSGSPAEALSQFRAVRRNADAGEEMAPSLAGLGIRTAAWIPLSAGAERTDRLLILYRSSGEPFTDADLQVLGSVAYRLCLAVEAGQRNVAIERLAQSGHRLARHLEPEPLLTEATELFRQLTDADHAWVTPLGEGTADETADPPPPTVLQVPVLRDGVPALLLQASRDRARPFMRDAAEMATIFATYLGAALVNAELYRALGKSEASLRLITDSISDLIAVVDAAGTFLYASPSHARELGHDPDRLLGRSVTELVHYRDRAALSAALAAVADAPKVEYRMRNGLGAWVWVESALRPASAAAATTVLSSRVIDERKRLEEELRQRATHDSLTGLANRYLVGQHLNDVLAIDAPGNVGLLFCDLDKFKAVNDRLGHEAGDELLRQVAARLNGCLRSGDLLARLGGDEFVFVLNGVTELAEVNAVGQRVLRALEAPVTLEGELVDVSASIGGVLGARGKTTAGIMLRNADAAMYAAKERGRGLVEVFDDAASTRSVDRLDIRSELSRALEGNQLEVYYQAIVTLRAPRIVAFEALLRWRHPERGFIPPDVFIPLAEETGAIVAIDQWVQQEACRQLAAWQRLPGHAELGISVNLSAAQLRRPDLAATILDTVRGAGIRPADLWLEVTERGYIQDDVRQFAATVRREGVNFALDDFGTSYSNLGYLQRFPITCLKVDRSFVSGLAEPDGGRKTVRAILAIAESLGLDVVAEGIETEAQREMLVAMGCRRGQGYLFSRPVPAAEATTLLMSQHASTQRVSTSQAS